MGHLSDFLESGSGSRSISILGGPGGSHYVVRAGREDDSYAIPIDSHCVDEVYFFFGVYRVGFAAL